VADDKWLSYEFHIREVFRQAVLVIDS